MFVKYRVLTVFLCLGLSLGGTTGAAVAQLPEETASEQTEPFRRIDQPLWTRIAVTVGGLSFIAAELWWFQFSKTQARQAGVKQGIQEIVIAVDGGYSPNRVVVRAGQPVRLNFFRKDPSSCLEQVVLPDFHRAVDLELDRITPVEFTPEQAGEYPFHCGMNMFRGTVVVRDRAEISPAPPPVHSNGQVREASETPKFS